ncbi:hypothetical protein BJ944DRAFT_251507 [Cunninghamella echinulata]|nr:hypothetical protein BJ944DRAFT_251507 [Cunninghamella echinulata]
MQSPKPVIDFNFYEQPSTISFFANILEDLQQDLDDEGVDATFTAPELAYFVARFQQFQQDALGKQAIGPLRKNTTFTTLPARIPSSFFRVESLNKGSPLYIILLAAYSFHSDKDISDWQFDAPDEKDVYLELLTYIRKRLVSFGIVNAQPIIGFDIDVPNDLKTELSTMVNHMEGRIVDDLNTATHIIYNNDDPIFDSEQPRPFQVEEKHGSRVLLHYFGLPSSYDSWVYEGEYNGDLARPIDTSLQSSPYHLKLSWIKDSYTYNEWMNTSDYHYADYKQNFTNSLSSLKRTIKEDVLDSQDSPSKKIKSLDEENGTPYANGNDNHSPGSNAMQHDNEKNNDENNDDNGDDDDDENDDEDDDEDDGKVEKEKEKTLIKDEPTDVTTKSDEIQYNDNDNMKLDGSNDENKNTDKITTTTTENNITKYQSIQTHNIIIPSYASWFELNKVNDIECKSLPEFFDSKSKYKTPTIYKSYRDFMVNSYRINPLEYLTITACRRNLMGDVCAIIRVHSFLEQWGLINYQVDPTYKSSSLNISEDQQLRLVQSKSVIPMSPPLSATDLNRDYNITATAMAVVGSESELEKKKKSEDILKDDMKMDIDQNASPPISPSKQNQDDNLILNTSELKDGESKSSNSSIACITCKSDNLKLWYKHSQKKDIYLCESCLLDGKYSMELNPSDFMKELDEESADIETWTEEEKTLLLKGLDIYYDDWNKISDHVKTKSRDQCILYYLRLPTQDPYINTKLSELGMLQLDRTESSSLKDNTIMSTVAFLASTVKPEVAAAAADCKPMHLDKSTKSSVKDEEIDEEKENIEETDEKKDNQDNEKKNASLSSPRNELRDMLYQLIRNKMDHFKIKITQYEEKESLLEEERRKLEKEKHQLNQDQISFQTKMKSIRQEIIKQGGGDDQRQQHIETQQHSDKMNENNNLLSSSSSATSFNYQNPHAGMTPAEVQQQLAAAAAAAANGGSGSGTNHPPNRPMMGGQQQQQPQQQPQPMFLNPHQQQNYMQQRLQQQQMQLHMQMQMQQQQQQQQQQGGNQSNQPQNFNMMSL